MSWYIDLNGEPRDLHPSLDTTPPWWVLAEDDPAETDEETDA